MLSMPSYYEIEMNFADACRMVSNRANGDLLEGMKSIEALWEENYADADDEFFYDWAYELSAFNVVFENMSKLFK